MNEQALAPGSHQAGPADRDQPDPGLLKLLRDYGEHWRITRSVSPSGWIAVQHAAFTTQQALLGCTLTELGEKLSGHIATGQSAPGGGLPAGFARMILEDSRLTDGAIDALETRVVALEEVAAARGIRRWLAALRLARSLRESVRHIPGTSFAERRYEAASTEWAAAPGPREPA
jgi:hypothetical protein